MTSRYMREIPLRILHRKVGDEHVTLLQACYDNPIFHEEDAKDYRHSNGTEKASRTADHTVVDTCPTPDGAKLSLDGHVASDYMHSLPPASSLPRGHGGISFRGYRRSRCRLLLVGLCCLLVVLAVGISLLLLLIDDDESQTASPVITLAHVEGSLTIIDGPFSRYQADYLDWESDASRLLQNAFIYKMNAVFSSSELSSIYNSTQVVHIWNTRGHVTLTFFIHTPPRQPAPSSLVDQIRQVILDGLTGSLFVLDEKSLRLRIQVLRPVIPSTPAPGQCLPITYSKCVNRTDYSTWSLPNVLGHTSPEQVIAYLELHSFMLDTDCYGYTTDFFCSAFFPQCTRKGKPILPCKRYCQDVLSTCQSVYDEDDTMILPFTCDDLPDSDDSSVCRKNPFQDGKCVPVANPLCQGNGFNYTAFPNMLGGVAIDRPANQVVQMMDGTNKATHCYQYTLLFACMLIAPPCSGKPAPNHYIPVCASLCQVYKDRCEIFINIFNILWPSSLNCSALPDSPDPTVCVGYKEAREPEVIECVPGEVKCGDGRCIKASWLCDGFQDCSDNSDEQNCAACPPHETSCSASTATCISKSQECDGVSDCYMGTDETYCVRINPGSHENSLEAYNAEDGQWEEVCKDGWTPKMADVTCRQLGYKKALTTYFSPQSSNSSSMITKKTNTSDPSRLQSYLLKGQTSCPSSFIVRLMCWQTVCGSRPAHFVNPTRVVGGEEVRPGVWPWMASLHGGSAMKFFCGATILNSEWIITAAHCVGGADNRTDYWTISAGATRREAFSDHRQLRKPRALFRHPGFLTETVQDDIALIQLERPLLMNDYVRSVCLPEKAPEVGTRCFVVGWGKREDGAADYELALKEVDLDVTSWKHCHRALQASPIGVPYPLTKTMFCAGGTHSHDACQGDSGGPLLCKKDNSTDNWFQSGIVSWGVACAYPNIPGVYTNVTMYSQWIQEVMTNNTRGTEDTR